MRRIWNTALLYAGLMIVMPPVQASSVDEALAGNSYVVERSFSGNISWYGPAFHGRKTASGETFDMHKFTSAHRTLPFFTRVLVEDPRSGNAAIVKVNDRGPFVKTRVMDVSMGAAKRLGIISRGMAYVDCLVIKND
jgi:rare lipoprotein A